MKRVVNENRMREIVEEARKEYGGADGADKGETYTPDMIEIIKVGDNKGGANDVVRTDIKNQNNDGAVNMVKDN